MRTVSHAGKLTLGRKLGNFIDYDFYSSISHNFDIADEDEMSFIDFKHFRTTMGRFFFSRMNREPTPAVPTMSRVEDIRLRDVVEFIQTVAPEQQALTLLGYVRGYEDTCKPHMIPALIEKLRNAKLEHLADAVAAYLQSKK